MMTFPRNPMKDTKHNQPFVTLFYYNMSNLMKLEVDSNSLLIWHTIDQYNKSETKIKI
jgi:hypothetical protein